MRATSLLFGDLVVALVCHLGQVSSEKYFFNLKGLPGEKRLNEKIY